MGATSEIDHSVVVQGAEEWVVAVNEIIRAYRGTSPNPIKRQLGLHDAVARLQGLGLSEGDAIRWLEPRQKSAAHRLH
jgi:hypothetical protein